MNSGSFFISLYFFRTKISLILSSASLFGIENWFSTLFDFDVSWAKVVLLNDTGAR